MKSDEELLRKVLSRLRGLTPEELIELADLIESSAFRRALVARIAAVVRNRQKRKGKTQNQVTSSSRTRLVRSAERRTLERAVDRQTQVISQDDVYFAIKEVAGKTVARRAFSERPLSSMSKYLEKVLHDRPEIERVAVLKLLLAGASASQSAHGELLRRLVVK